jgi:hypothetical protein
MRQVEYGKEDLQFLVEDSNTQSVVFSTTVSFIPLQGQSSAQYTPPAPPVLFSVPYDVFYPFHIYSAAPARRRASGAALLASGGMLLLLGSAYLYR